MIIENINNNQNNNIWFTQIMIYSKLKHITKKVFIYAIIFMQIFYATYKVYIDNHKFINIKKLSNIIEDSFNNRRDLELSNDLNYTSDKSNIIDYLNNNYLLILNLTSNTYSGNWTKLFFKNFSFFDQNIKEGLAELVFKKVKLSDRAEKTTSIKTDIILKEGKYTDKQIGISFNFSFPLYNKIDKYFLDDEKVFIIENTHQILDIYRINYYLYRKNETIRINKTNINLILVNKDYSFSPSYKKRKYSPFFNVKLYISSEDFNLTINSITDNEENLIDKIKFYSFILSFFGLIEIYYSSKLIIKINHQNDIGNKISILTMEIISSFFKCIYNR